MIALWFLLVAVPLAWFPTLYEYVLLPKTLMLNMGVLLLSVTVTIQGWKQGGYPFPKTPLAYPTLTWAGINLLTIPLSTHLLDSVVEATQVVQLVILFLVLATAFKPHNLPRFLAITSLSGAAIACVGILQYHGLAYTDITSNAMPSATFGNKNFLAEYLICLIPVAAALWPMGYRKAAVVCVALMTTCLLYTGCRAAWIGMAVAVAIIWGVNLTGFGHKERRGLARLVLLPAERLWNMGSSPIRPIFLIALFAVLAFLLNSKVIFDDSISQRLAFWSGTLRMIWDHPLGVGPGGWIRMYPLYDGGATIQVDGYHPHPHNDYLSVAAETGILGLAAWLAVLWVGFMGIRGLKHPSAPFLMASMLALCVAALFGFPKDNPATAMWPYIVFGVVEGLRG